VTDGNHALPKFDRRRSGSTGVHRTRRRLGDNDLLVDSGFTGKSAFVLPQSATSIVQATAPASHASGALQGLQNRVVVTCRISMLFFQRSFVAILADTTALALRPESMGSPASHSSANSRVAAQNACPMAIGDSSLPMTHVRRHSARVLGR
jgi:hypothetical protein